MGLEISVDPHARKTPRMTLGCPAKLFYSDFCPISTIFGRSTLECGPTLLVRHKMGGICPKSSDECLAILGIVSACGSVDVSFPNKQTNTSLPCRGVSEPSVEFLPVRSSTRWDWKSRLIRMQERPLERPSDVPQSFFERTNSVIYGCCTSDVGRQN